MELASLNLVSAVVEISVIIDIFKYKSINDGVMFNCVSDDKTVAIQKSFNSRNIKMSMGTEQYRVKIPYSHKNLGIIVNASCANWFGVFSYFNEDVCFKSPFTWTIFTENLSVISETLTKYPIEVDSDIIIVNRIGRVFNMFEAYNTGFLTFGSFRIKYVGYWNNVVYMNRTNRRDLSGVILKCTVVMPKKISNETFEQYVERSRPSRIDTLHRLKYYTLLKYLRDMYNFSYALRRTYSWGYLNNNSFDGMIGALQRHESDIGGSPVLFRPERARVVDYAIQTWKAKQCFIFRHPKHPSGFYNIYTRPLSNKVWYCILAILTLSGGILCMMIKLEALRIPDDEKDTSVSLAFLVIWSAICQQGMMISRSAIAVKFLIFVTFVFAVTLYQYYNATVVSTLLREPPKNIRTLQDLLNSELKVGIEDVLYNKDFFKKTTDPVALELYHKKVSTGNQYNFYSTTYGMSLVKKGGFAFHVDAASGYGEMRKTFTEREVCEAHEVLMYPSGSVAAVVSKRSPFIEHITYGILKMTESGLLYRIKTIWEEPKPLCVKTLDSSIFSVSIREFSTALIALACGMVAALLILISEIITSKLRTKEMINIQV